MPLVYTKEEIKEYLADRGFDVDDEEVIKKFIHDLKKMIKFENRQKRRVKLGHDPAETNLESSAPSSHATNNFSQGHFDSRLNAVSSSSIGVGTNDDEPGTSYAAAKRNNFEAFGTKEQRDRELTKKKGPPKLLLEKDDRHTQVVDGIGGVRHKAKLDSHSELHIRSGRPSLNQQEAQNVSLKQRKSDSVLQPKPPTGFTATNKVFQDRDVQKNIAQTANSRKQDYQNQTNRRTQSAMPRYGKENELSHNDTSELLYILGDMLGEHEDESSSASGSSKRHMLGPSNAVKRDPVALYYYYKKCWDKQSFPGENRHMKLRWNVRAQTVGNYPCIDGRPVKYLR